jgi:hypothetical protein
MILHLESNILVLSSHCALKQVVSWAPLYIYAPPATSPGSATMLPTTRPKKKLSIFTSSIFPNGPVAAEEPAPAKSRVHLIRQVLIGVVSLVLAIAFIVWGPSGDFISGRAFTVSQQPVADIGGSLWLGARRSRRRTKSRISSTTGRSHFLSARHR